MISEANRRTAERDFLAAVVQYAEAHSWRVHHVLEARHYAKRIGPGYPDLTMVRVHNHGGRMVLAELKSERGKVSEPQKQWLEAFVTLSKYCGADVRVEVYLWRPHDWDTVVRVLE